MAYEPTIHEVLTLTASCVALLVSLLAYRRSGPAAALAKQQLLELEKTRLASERPVLEFKLLSGDAGRGSLTVTNAGQVEIRELKFHDVEEGPISLHRLNANAPYDLRPGQTITFPASRTLDRKREVFVAHLTFLRPDGIDETATVKEYWQ